MYWFLRFYYHHPAFYTQLLMIFGIFVLQLFGALHEDISINGNGGLVTNTQILEGIGIF